MVFNDRAVRVRVRIRRVVLINFRHDSLTVTICHAWANGSSAAPRHTRLTDLYQTIMAPGSQDIPDVG